MSFEYTNKNITGDIVLSVWINIQRYVDISINESCTLATRIKIGQNVDDHVYDTLEDSICINLSNEIIEYEY
jgi:hypothetical protein